MIERLEIRNGAPSGCGKDFSLRAGHHSYVNKNVSNKGTIRVLNFPELMMMHH
jgi:hypothetical protein